MRLGILLMIAAMLAACGSSSAPATAGATEFGGDGPQKMRRPALATAESRSVVLDLPNPDALVGADALIGGLARLRIF